MTTRRLNARLLRIAGGISLFAAICGVAYVWFVERKPPFGLVMLLTAATLATAWADRRWRAFEQPNS